MWGRRPIWGIMRAVRDEGPPGVPIDTSEILASCWPMRRCSPAITGIAYSGSSAWRDSSMAVGGLC